MSRGIALLVLALAVASLDAEQIRLRFVPASVGGGGGGDEHALFDTFSARSDCVAAWSLRPVEGETISGGELNDILAAGCSKPHYENQLMPRAGTAIPKGFRNGSSLSTGESTYRITYPCATCGNGNSHLTDTYPEAQDGAKLRIPGWQQTLLTLAADIDADDTTITLSGTGGPTMGTGRGLKFSDSDEIILLTQTDPQTGPLQNVNRSGNFGTTPTSHTAGATVYVTTNSISTAEYLVIPIRQSGDETTGWLFTWESWTGSEWLGLTGDSQGLKEFQVVSYADRYFEVQPRWDACGVGSTHPVAHPDCVTNTHLGGMSARLYFNTMAPMERKYYAAPVTNPWLNRAQVWKRYYLFLRQRTDTDPANFRNVTTLAAAMDATQTTMTVNHPNNLAIDNSPAPAVGNSVFYGGFQTAINAPGRAVMLSGGEIVTIVDGDTSGTTRTYNVVREQYGTTASTHSSGANVAMSFDDVTFWMADEDQDPVLIFDLVPGYIPADRSTVGERGAIKEFWVEFDTSNSNALQVRADDNWADLVTYIRNFSAHKGISRATVESLLAKPVGAARTLPPSAFWRDVQLLIVIGLLVVLAIRALVWARGQARRRVAPRAVWERVSHA